MKLVIDIEKMIPKDDPVRLMCSFVEQLSLTALENTYDGKTPAGKADPRTMLKIVLYAAMNHIFSSRAIEEQCKSNIKYWWLLEGADPPDYTTITRFISIHLAACSKEFLTECTSLLYQKGEISGEDVFIDGTKVESVANKYTFVWKKAVLKNQAKMLQKAADLINKCEAKYGVSVIKNNKITLTVMKKLRRKLRKVQRKEGIRFVHGSGRRKSAFQKDFEQLDEYIQRFKNYIYELHTLGDRNSYSKTDTDATFMRMKEDAMRNGQLKPAYNIQHCIDGQYIVWVTISSHPCDNPTLRDTLREMNDRLPFHYKNVTADSGYESEENYEALKKMGIVAYIKPNNYEKSKTRKYKNDIGRVENMDYDEKEDTYTCSNGKKLKNSGTKKRKTSTGYVQTTTIYTCEDCRDCPYKKQCIKGNNCKTPLEDRTKRLNVARTLQKDRAEDLERITSEKGKQLRLNRSIQAEGSFAETKEDLEFRRYLYKGADSALAESVLLATAANMMKYHFKIQGGRCGQFLTPLKKNA